MSGPVGQQDRDREHLLWWLQAVTGREVWLGIHAPKEPWLHGHGYWVVCGLCKAEHNGAFYVHLRRAPDKGPGYNVWTDHIVHGAEYEPIDDSWSRRWDEGLSAPPTLEEIIAEAERAQGET